MVSLGMKYILAVFINIYSIPVHDWYEYDCCNDDDCRPMRSGDYTLRSDGSAIVRYKGDVVELDKEAVRPSQDLEAHICFQELEDERSYLCLYYKPSLF